MLWCGTGFPSLDGHAHLSTPPATTIRLETLQHSSWFRAFNRAGLQFLSPNYRSILSLRRTTSTLLGHAMTLESASDAHSRQQLVADKPSLLLQNLLKEKLTIGTMSLWSLPANTRPRLRSWWNKISKHSRERQRSWYWRLLNWRDVVVHENLLFLNAPNVLTSSPNSCQAKFWNFFSPNWTWDSLVRSNMLHASINCTIEYKLRGFKGLAEREMNDLKQK